MYPLWMIRIQLLIIQDLPNNWPWCPHILAMAHILVDGCSSTCSSTSSSIAMDQACCGCRESASSNHCWMLLNILQVGHCLLDIFLCTIIPFLLHFLWIHHIDNACFWALKGYCCDLTVMANVNKWLDSWRTFPFS